MPQVHNPGVVDQDATAFGKGSRFMKANAFRQSTMRRVKALNTIEARFNRMRLSVLERNTQQAFNVREHARVNIIKSYKRTLAYKLVVNKHPIRKNASFSAALKDNYDLHSLRKEIEQMMIDIQPDSIEKKKAKAKILDSKDAYENVILTNRSKIVDIVPKKVVKPEEVLQSRSPTPPPVPTSFGKKGPPLRGLAQVPQAVSLKMMKEKSWLGKGPKPSEASGSPRNVSPSKSINPHSKLPPIAAAVEVAA